MFIEVLLKWSPILAVHVNSTFAFSSDTEIVTSENALSLYPVLPCCPLTCVFSVCSCVSVFFVCESWYTKLL